MSGHFNIMLDLKSDADLADVEKILDAELAQVKGEVISNRELSRAVTKFESGYVWGLETLSARAEILQGYNHFVGTPDYITGDLDRYRKTTPDKIKEVAAKFLTQPGRVEIITMPAGKGGK